MEFALLKNNVCTHSCCPCLFKFKRQFELPGLHSGGAIMERAVVQVTLFGLLLVLASTLPNKVRSQNLKDTLPHCKETESIEHIIFN